MKSTHNNRLVAALACAVVALAIGCATTRQTEDLLSAAGFKIVAATTPQQQARLEKLPPHKVTMVQRDGKTHFVFPDMSRHLLYVGQQAQFDEYQKLRVQKQLEAEQLEAAAQPYGPDWGGWGSWDVVGAPVTGVMGR
jgi:hypothetical protein